MYGMYKRGEVNFEYRSEIGQDGRNSKAFVAHDRFLDAELVIKQIPKSDFTNPEGFFTESQALYRAAHPHVVQIQYACECEENIYIALPYYKKGSLKSLIDSRGMSVREAVRFGIHICSALHNIHSKGLIHFDVKPDNVLLSDRGEALLSDFGLAQYVDEGNLAKTGKIYLRHVAPEHFTQKEFNSQYDIYQLGLTLYRMIFGNKEFIEQMEQYTDQQDYFKAVLNERFPSRSFPEHIPSKLEKIINKCLKADLSQRYSSALDVANALSAIDDKTLDWIHCTDKHGRSWKKSTDSHEYRLHVPSTGQSVAEKRTLTGKWTKVKEFCSDNLGKAAIKKFLRQF